MADAPRLTREQAVHGVESRLAGMLLARPEAQLTGVPMRKPDPPLGALPPGAEAGPRVVRGSSLLVPPQIDVFTLFGADWQAAGWRPQVVGWLDGRVLFAHDPAGYAVLLVQSGTVAELYVVSPVLAGGSNGRFVGGLLTGLGYGLIAPCLTVGALISRFYDLARIDDLGQVTPFLGLLPLGLLGGALLLRPETREFGTGLLIGGAAIGIIVAGVCSSMLS